MVSVCPFGLLRGGVLGCCVGERLESCRQQEAVDSNGTTGALFDTQWLRWVGTLKQVP